MQYRVYIVHTLTPDPKIQELRKMNIPWHHVQRVESWSSHSKMPAQLGLGFRAFRVLGCGWGLSNSM